jgi:uncharacterized protein
VDIAGVAIHLVHDLEDLVLPPQARVVVCGHSHQPKVEEREGVLYVNPGSAGPRRFRLPISAAELHIVQGGVTARLMNF